MAGGSNYLDREPIFEPPPGKIVIEITQTEERYGSIILPPTSRSTRVLGTVHTTYQPYTDPEDGTPYEPWVKVGDLVIIGQYSGTEVKIGRKQYVILKEFDVLARIRFPEGEQPPVINANL